MILNGRPVTVEEFTEMDRACDWNLGQLMQGSSPTMIFLCGWILERRDNRSLTWAEYRKREIDIETLAAQIELAEPNPTSGNGQAPTPVSVISGDSLQSNYGN